MTALASLGLFLAACGLYTVVAYLVSMRTGEIGLRMALGASRRDVLRLVMSRKISLVAIGLVAGVLAAVSALASYIPATVATAVSPLAALKAE
jgi:putative ABC transport system permease protein